MQFIGLRLCAHDSNISYSNNTQVKYYKSERDLQQKHHGFKDLNQWKKIIDQWNINPSEIDAIGIVIDCFDYPHLKCDESKLYEIIDIPLFKFMGFDCPIFRIDHHYAHALSGWPLGIDSSIQFIFDGFGDDKTIHSLFRNNQRILNYKLTDGESLGRILGTVGNILGLHGLTIDHAGKIISLNAYANPQTKISYESNSYSILSLKELWNFEHIKSIKNDHQKLFDYIRDCHEETERIYVKHFEEYSNENDTILYSGGIAQNIVINSKLKKVRPNLHIPPHCNDEGLSLGVIEFLRQYYNQKSFDTTGYPYWQSDQAPKTRPSKETIKQTAEHLANGKIVGWYQGYGEVGSRALGNRSILMNPSVKNGKDILNQKVKRREWFRPFGASILEEETQNYFEWEGSSPYMLYTMNLLNKDLFPAITHVDGTCRIQTVSQELEDYYSLIEEFKNITGIPMLLNTSLNNGGKPICATPYEAFELLTSTDLDILVVGNAVYEKNY